MATDRSWVSWSTRFLCVALPLLFGTVAGGTDNSPAYRAEIRVILENGVLQQTSIGGITSHVTRARRLNPSDPAADYAYGLALAAHNREDRAISAYQAALKRQPSFLPAWKALLRERLIREEFNTLLDEMDKLAGLVNDPKSDWQPVTDRELAATYLGRISAYLSLPGTTTKGMTLEKLQKRNSAIEQRLGSQFAAAFRTGRVEIQKSYEKRKSELEALATKQRIKQQQQTDERLSDINARRKDLQEESQSLKLTAAQWKSRIEKQLKTADTELRQLQRDFQAIDLANARIARLAAQNTVEMGRMQTEYELRGIRGALLARQPALLRLQRESTQYANQRLALQNRAAIIRRQAQTLLTSRAAAIQQYQTATGKLVRRDAVINRWNQTLKKSSLAMQERNKPGDDKADQSRLLDSAAYFVLDEQQEARRLLQAYGFTSPNTPSRGPTANVKSGDVP